MAQVIQWRRGTAAAWTAANPTLAEGEAGLELDTGKWKFGNGTTNWAGLPYVSTGSDWTLLDAKGDLIAASADNTPARLAVGSNGQVLIADSTAAAGVKWGAVAYTETDPLAILKSLLDAKGDLIAASANDTPGKLTVGTDGFVLTADSAQTLGVKWAAGATGSGLPADTVIAAAVRIIANKLLAGDANNVWRLLGNGQMEWGAGGASALDVTLQRISAGVLQLGLSSQRGRLRIVGQTTGDSELEIQQSTDTFARLMVTGRGDLLFGPGNLTQDVKLYREAADILALDDQLHIVNANGIKFNDNTVQTTAATGASDATTTTKGIVQLAGDLAGTAASPQIAAGVIVDADVAAANKDGTAATPSLRTLGTGAAQAAAGNDSRIVNALDKTLLDAKGDLIAASADNTPARLAVGTNGQVLTADSAQTAGVKWATPSGGGTAPSYGTTPPASPADGDEWIYPVANGVLWRFRYNAGSASAYKWEFVGGSDAYAETAGTDTTTSATAANLTNGPSFALPRAGDWMLEVDAVASNTTADGQCFLNVGDSSIAANTVITSAFGQQESAGRWSTVHIKGRANGLTAITVAVKAWGTGGGTISYQTRRLSITPVRVS